MKRKIAALTLGAAIVLAGACASSEPESGATDTTSSAADASTTTVTPADMKLVDVPVEKPTPGVKVSKDALPAELSNFAEVAGLSPDQQSCVNGAMKQAVDKDPTLTEAPGKVMSLGGKAIAVCDAGDVFTDSLLQSLTGPGAEGAAQVTPEQSACLKEAFKDDADATAKFISGALTMSEQNIRDGLAPFEAKCGVTLMQPDTP